MLLLLMTSSVQHCRGISGAKQSGSELSRGQGWVSEMSLFLVPGKTTAITGAVFPSSQEVPQPQNTEEAVPSQGSWQRELGHA